jgi:hypothetical protein
MRKLILLAKVSSQWRYCKICVQILTSKVAILFTKTLKYNFYQFLSRIR